MERILVVGPSWVGDMVMSQTLFALIKNANPGVTLDVLAPAWSAPILGLMPEIDNYLEFPLGHGRIALGKRRAIGKSLAGHGYQQAIVLPNSFKSALVPFFAGIPLRTGWHGESRYVLLNDRRRLDESALPLMVERYAALGIDSGQQLPDELPRPELVARSDRVNAVATGFLGEPYGKLLALCPGAEFGRAKQWPAEHYAQTADHYAGLGYRVVLLGSAKDQKICAEVSAGVRRAECTDLSGRTSLEEAVMLLAAASLVISNDSGLMHIAAALQRPTLGIFGATSSTFTPPRGGQAAIVSSSIECSPCFARECPLGHHRCMRELGSSSVIEVADTLVKGGAS